MKLVDIKQAWFHEPRKDDRPQNGANAGVVFRFEDGDVRGRLVIREMNGKLHAQILEGNDTSIFMAKKVLQAFADIRIAGASGSGEVLEGPPFGEAV